jgi:RNA polymerase sigma-70 factor, ECF subfamily
VTDSDHDAVDLDRLRRGDPKAFASLVDRHQRLILSLGQSMGFDNADLDDAAAEVFANVYLALPGFQGRSRLRTWVYSIAVRTFNKHRQRRAGPGAMPITDGIHDPHSTSPDRRMQDKELYERLWAAVATLDARSAAAVDLYYRHGWKLDEIAAALECPAGTIKTLLFRAREQLRRVLAAQESPP